MNTKEAIEAAKLNIRVKTNCSLFDKELDKTCSLHNYRVIACDNETDVLECYKCGMQTTSKCNFDEDMA